MRAAWMLVADNMVKCNSYWRTQAANWATNGVEPRDVRTRIANRLTRIVFRMVSGRSLFQHPSHLDRMYVMDKLMVYLQNHKVPPGDIVHMLEHAVEQIPPADRQAEAKPIRAAYQKQKRGRRKDVQQMSTLLVGVLARLGIANPDEEELESN